jgi:hypothetical protein
MAGDKELKCGWDSDGLKTPQIKIKTPPTDLHKLPFRSS